MLSRVEGVVGVGNSRHSVDLEILIRSNLGHALDGAPVCERGFGVVEPVVGEVLQVIVVDVSDALSNLRSRNSAALHKDLGTDLLGNLRRSFLGKQLVVEAVAATENFHIIDEVGVNGWQANTAVVHLAGEDLISEEIVSKDAAVRVGVVE